MTLPETLVQLVEVNSVVGTEGRLCTAVAERLLATWDRHGVDRVGNSLIVGKRTDRPLISLFGHLDTVPEQGESAPHIRDGRLFGLGSSDMKAGLAVMIHLLEADEVIHGPYDLVGVFYDGEEGPADRNGLGAVLAHAPWLADSELAIVMEPTDNELHLGCQGVINATLTFEGRAAHSSRPWLGENAITKAGAFLDALHRRPLPAITVGGLEFVEVFSVTMAEGGVARNILPDRFRLNLNHRFPPSFTEAEAEARLRKVAESADRIDIVDHAPGAGVPADNRQLARLEGISGAPRSSKQGWTDVATLTAHGIPAVNFGPGEVEQAHKVGESVALANLDESFRVLVEFLTT